MTVPLIFIKGLLLRKGRAFPRALMQDVFVQKSLIEAPEEDENAAPATTARLQNLRLTREEMGFKTVPLVSGLDSATAADLQAIPEVRQSGSFSAFTLASSNPNQQWVVSFLKLSVPCKDTLLSACLNFFLRLLADADDHAALDSPNPASPVSLERLSSFCALEEMRMQDCVGLR